MDADLEEVGKGFGKSVSKKRKRAYMKEKDEE